MEVQGSAGKLDFRGRKRGAVEVAAKPAKPPGAAAAALAQAPAAKKLRAAKQPTVKQAWALGGGDVAPASLEAATAPARGAQRGDRLPAGSGAEAPQTQPQEEEERRRDTAACDAAPRNAASPAPTAPLAAGQDTTPPLAAAAAVDPITFDHEVR